MNMLRTARHLVPMPILLGSAGLLTAVQLFSIMRNSSMLRSWPSVIETVNGGWMVQSILVVGIAAAVAVGPWSRRELTAGLPDPGHRRFAATGTVIGLMAASVHLVVVLLVTGWGLVAGLPGEPRLWPVPAVLLGLWASAMFGTAATRIGASFLSPLLAIGLWVGLLFLLGAVGGSDLVNLGGTSVILVGLAPDPVTMVWRAAWMGALGWVAWWIATRGREALRHPVLVLLLPATVVVGVVTSQQTSVGFSAVPVEWSCSDGSPQVCVAAEFEDQLDDYTQFIEELSPLAADIGLPLPQDGYRQAVGVEPTVGSFNVDRAVNPEQLSFDLVQFSLPCSVSWSTEQLDQADQVVAWLTTGIGAAAPYGVTPPTRDEAAGIVDDLRCSQ